MNESYKFESIKRFREKKKETEKERENQNKNKKKPEIPKQPKRDQESKKHKFDACQPPMFV